MNFFAPIASLMASIDSMAAFLDAFGNTDAASRPSTSSRSYTSSCRGMRSISTRLGSAMVLCLCVRVQVGSDFDGLPKLCVCVCVCVFDLRVRSKHSMVRMKKLLIMSSRCLCARSSYFDTRGEQKRDTRRRRRRRGGSDCQ